MTTMREFSKIVIYSKAMPYLVNKQCLLLTWLTDLSFAIGNTLPNQPLLVYV